MLITLIIEIFRNFNSQYSRNSRTSRDSRSSRDSRNSYKSINRNSDISPCPTNSYNYHKSSQSRNIFTLFLVMSRSCILYVPHIQ